MTTERFTTRNGVFYTDTKTGYEFQCYGEVANMMNELAEENEQLKSVLLGVINRLYYCENCLIGEISSNISEDEFELKEDFKKEFGKYGWNVND